VVMSQPERFIFRSSGGIHLSRDDVVARSSSLSFQPSRGWCSRTNEGFLDEVVRTLGYAWRHARVAEAD
jgi:hypothetical protein